MGACQCTPAVKEGHHYWEWAGIVFNACVYSDAEKAALLLGLINILLWIVAQIPQLVQTVKEKQVEAISLGLFVLWLLGDITNLIACVLTNASSTQLYTAIYFCIIDVIMVSQYVYYKYIYDRNRDTVRKMTIIPAVALLLVVGLKTAATSTTGLEAGALTGRELYTSSAGHIDGNGTIPIDPQPDCEFHVPVGDVANLTGTILSWVSAVCYFVSRIPQVVKNFQRKNVDGLNPAMFLCAVAANTCYGLSIILMKPTMNADFFKNKLPFIVGSMGTLIFDVIILIEYKLYNTGSRVGYHTI